MLQAWRLLSRVSFLRAHAGPLAFLTLIAFAVVWIGTHTWRPVEPHLVRGLPRTVSGDEPHYLVIVHSLLFDHDLVLDDDYRAVARGGPEAGSRFAGASLDPHTRLVAHDGSASILWYELYNLNRPLPEPSDAHGFRFAAKTPNPLVPGSYVQVPAHPPAYAAMLAALIGPFGPAPGDVERMVGIVTVCIAVATLLAAYAAGVVAALTPRESAAAVALFALCSPWLVYSKSLFTEAAAALLLLPAAIAHLRGQTAVAGTFLGAALWLKPYYALAGCAWIVQRLFERRFRDAAVLAGVLAAAAAGLIAFNCTYAATPLVSGARPLTFTFSPISGISNWLFGPEFGLLVFAPWFAAIAAFIWFVPNEARVGVRALAWTCLLQLAFLALIAPTDGGSGYGPRYMVQLMPWLSMLAVLSLRSRTRAFSMAFAALAFVNLLMTVPAALQYENHSYWTRPPHLPLKKWITG